MTHYFFHIRNSDVSSQDDEGADFASFALAQHEAVMSVRDLVIEAVKWGQPIAGLEIEIADENGKILGLVSAAHAWH